MSLQKQKDRIKKIEARIGTHMRVIESSALILCLLVAVFSFHVSKAQTPAEPQNTAQNQSAAHKPATAKKKTHTKPTPAVPKPAAATSTATATASAAPAATAGSSKVEPVVKPSPTSKVKGLSPTSTTAPKTPSSSQVTTGYTSLNWSGYLAANASFTSVSGSWTAPSATGNGTTTSADSTWIGIGGVTSGDLIQVGTQDIVTADGHLYTSAFYEMLPDSSVNIGSMVVTAGDRMTASVSETGSSIWSISITDNTTGKSFTKTVSYSSSLSSAEWIEEDPSYASGGLVPFDNFGEAVFTGASAVANGVSVNLATGTAQPVIMVDSSDRHIAVPSTIIGSNSFTVTP